MFVVYYPLNLSFVVMEDDWQLQTGLQWQTFLNVRPDWHHELSVW